MQYLLTKNSHKIEKTNGSGKYREAILYMLPDSALCPFWTKECRRDCLRFSGRLGMEVAQKAMMERREMFKKYPQAFYQMLRFELDSFVRSNEADGVSTLARLNGTSDIDWAEWCFNHRLPCLFTEYPSVQWIDYTKDLQKCFRRPLFDNYHLTYSYNSNTPAGAVRDIYRDTPFNVAVIYQSVMPKRLKIDGKTWRCINGDDSDMRHLDKSGAIVALKYKVPIGSPRKDKTMTRGLSIIQEGAK